MAARVFADSRCRRAVLVSIHESNSFGPASVCPRGWIAQGCPGLPREIDRDLTTDTKTIRKKSPEKRERAITKLILERGETFPENSIDRITADARE